MALKPSPRFFEIENDDTLFKIPLRNKEKNIIGYTLVDEHRYNELNKYRWSLSRSDRGYAKCSINRITYLMHHMVAGKPIDGMYIDHKNGNRLDNRESNLHPVTYSQNSQNRSRSEGKKYISEYIGLSKQSSGKWRTQVKLNGRSINLGNFEKETDAARQYDIYVLLKVGQYSKTNGLVSFEEAIQMNINPDDLVKSKKNRTLPTGICYKKKDKKYKVSVVYKGELYEKYFVDLEPAMLQLQDYLNHIEDLKAKEKEEHYSKDITKDKNGNAILLIKNKEIFDEVIVDDDKWHDLTLYSWNVCNDEYYKAHINNKHISLHRYVLLGDEAFLKKGKVDHKNRNKKDNKKNNLRLVDARINSHNISKSKSGSSSKYLGVSFNVKSKVFIAYIYCDNEPYYCGSYKTEKEAARARNAKAIELHGDLANLNDISDDEEEDKYKKEDKEEEEEILTNQLNEININE